MSVVENRLVFDCHQVGEAASEFMDWVADNGMPLGAERVSLLHELYENGAAAERLALSANLPPSVAFVGPPRAGKTGIVIPLVRGGGAGRLMLRFEGIQEAVDYTSQILPDGRAGLAMAVRLSSKKRAALKNFPVGIRLLSIPDVIKILASAFLADAAGRELVPTLDDVRIVHQAAAAKADNVELPGLSEDDVWDIRAHLAERFGSGPVFRALSAANYWQTLAKHGPYLSNKARGELLQLLWGGLAPFTRAFVKLAGIVETLGHTQEANCALNAVVTIDPRTGRLLRATDSVIDGATGARCMTDGDDAVLVCNEYGLWNSVSRTGLAALASELRLTVQTGGGGVLDNADVLEFPGIDTGQSAGSFLPALRADAGVLGQVFMRAKAAYLLDRSIIDHRITSMVVCIDPATREVGELAGLVQKWVERTHGADANVREHRDSALFLALTKIDKDLAPAQLPEQDWDDRIRSILHDGFGRQHTWPHQWITGRPFDGVHLVRSPSVRRKQLLDYGGDGSESGFKPAHQSSIERLRIGFLTSDIVRRHVADPPAVWREAMVLNDGGISYLAQSIAAVCDARVKRRQLMLALNGLRKTMKRRLQRYHLSDSFAFEQDRRHISGLHVVRRLRQCAESRRLGHLMRSLQVPDAELADVLHDLDIKPRNGSNAPAESATADAAAIAFGQAAIDHWVRTIRALANNAAACQKYQMPRQALLDLVDELVIGAVRLGLDRRIAEMSARLIGDANDWSASVDKVAICAARIISDYVTSLGFEQMMSNVQLRRKGKEGQPIFAPRNAIQLHAIGDAQTAVANNDFESDWSQAFLNLVEDNVGGLRERDISDEQNRKLGRLLKLLDITLV